MAKKIEKYLIVSVVTLMGGSVFLPILMLFTLLSATSISTGTIKMLFALCLYMVSAHLVCKSPKKDKQKKIIAWSFSIFVHCGLILFVALSMNIGVSVLALMIAEGCIAIVSTVGLLYVALNDQLYIEA
jgi:small-conductance mechanosensitive channel